MKKHNLFEKNENTKFEDIEISNQSKSIINPSFILTQDKICTLVVARKVKKHVWLTLTSQQEDDGVNPNHSFLIIESLTQEGRNFYRCDLVVDEGMQLNLGTCHGKLAQLDQLIKHDQKNQKETLKTLKMSKAAFSLLYDANENDWYFSGYSKEGTIVAGYCKELKLFNDLMDTLKDTTADRLSKKSIKLIRDKLAIELGYPSLKKAKEEHRAKIIIKTYSYKNDNAGHCFLKEVMNGADFLGLSWMISVDQAIKTQKQAEQDEKNPPYYAKLGNTNLYQKSLSLENQHNCDSYMRFLINRLNDPTIKIDKKVLDPIANSGFVDINYKNSNTNREKVLKAITEEDDGLNIINHTNNNNGGLLNIFKKSMQ